MIQYFMFLFSTSFWKPLNGAADYCYGFRKYALFSRMVPCVCLIISALRQSAPANVSVAYYSTAGI